MKQKPRLEEVERLATVALNAMGDDVRDATAMEVLSACLSLAMSSIKAVEECGGNLEGFRQPLEKMYALLPPQRMN